MKVVHINCLDFGSTGKIISDIAAEDKENQSYLLVPKKTRQDENIRTIPVCVTHEQGVYRRIASVLGYQFGFAPVSTGRILHQIRKIQPDVVHLHSINVNMVNIYRLLRYLKKHDIPTVVTNHAEFFYTGSCSYAYDCEKWKTGCGDCPNRQFAAKAKNDTTARAWRKMKDAFAGFKSLRVISVSPWQYERSVQSPILEGIPQDCILNGINTDIFRWRQPDRQQKMKTVLMATASFDPEDKTVKGGYYFVKLAKRFLGEPVQFLVAGFPAKHMGEIPENIRVLGQIADQDKLAELYAAADIAVTMSPRETFGMTVAEALCCGTPVVGFRNGGSDSIAIPAYTELVSFGDVEQLEQRLREKWLAFKETQNAQLISGTACQVYAKKKMARSYLELYQSLLDTK